MSQELGFVPEDPTYSNPFRNVHQDEVQLLNMSVFVKVLLFCKLKELKKGKKKKMKSKKGPKLRTHRTEL